MDNVLKVADLKTKVVVAFVLVAGATNCAGASSLDRIADELHAANVQARVEEQRELDREFTAKIRANAGLTPPAESNITISVDDSFVGKPVHFWDSQEAYDDAHAAPKAQWVSVCEANPGECSPQSAKRYLFDDENATAR